MNRSRIDAYIQEQEQLHTLTRRDIEAVQLKKLNRLLSCEKERGGFYGNLPDRLDSLADLASLPFTTDEDLAHRAGGMLLTSQGEVQRVLSDATSGTTGAAKRVFYTEGDLERTVRLYMAGLGELIFPGSITMICFPFSGPFGLGELIAEAISRLGARPLRLGPGLSYGEYRDVLAQEQPDTFVGMPVQLLSMLRVCGRGSLRRALVSGDACPESVIQACESILGSRLFPHYGSREMGMAGAITCPAHEGMHLRETDVIAEIIGPDGTVLPHGETGELVITTVGMEALPLIRYRTGDFTRILPSPCPCGSEVIRLDRLHRGGEEDLLSRLDDALFRLPALADCRIERTSAGFTVHALVTPQPARQLPEAAFEAQLRRTLQEFIPGDAFHLELADVTDTDRSLYPGKRRIE